MRGGRGYEKGRRWHWLLGPSDYWMVSDVGREEEGQVKVNVNVDWKPNVVVMIMSS